MSYIFQSLRHNKLIAKGDGIALITPIFTPYLEIPGLEEYQLNILDLESDENDHWQVNDSSLQRLLDPDIKVLCLVNPSNPASVKLNYRTLMTLKQVLTEDRPDLMVITDDVYATFANDFCSVFASCPVNTLCVYSFSKYFGATGWRLGVIALHDDNVFDRHLQGTSAKQQFELRSRYESITGGEGCIHFLERMVADSRTVALHHTAGLSSPQQLQMMLFALMCLMDSEQNYKKNAQRLIQSRYETLYQSIGLPTDVNEDFVGYYTLLDLHRLAETFYGAQFCSWFNQHYSSTDFLLRLASEKGIVLLPARGFDVYQPSVRVSLANLTQAEYIMVGSFTRQVLQEYFDEYQSERSSGT